MNNDWKPTEQNIGQPVLDTFIPPQGTLNIGTKWYDVDTTKLTSTKDIVEFLTVLEMRVCEDSKYFDMVKKFLIIPENPKTLDEIKEEFDEKIDNLSVTTKWKFAYYKQSAEDRYKAKFDRIIQDFEYAREHGEFAPKIAIGTLSGSYLVSNGGGVEWETSFVIKQENKHEGYYTFSNGQYFKYYMQTKPNVIARFFMKTCLALRWVDEKNDK